MDKDKSELLETLRIDRTASAPQSRTHWMLYAGGAVLAMALAVGGWSMLQDKAKPVRATEALPLAKSAGTNAGASLLDATGYVVARREATVGPKISGKLRDVLIEEGMHVEAKAEHLSSPVDRCTILRSRHCNPSRFATSLAGVRAICAFDPVSGAGRGRVEQGVFSLSAP